MFENTVKPVVVIGAAAVELHDTIALVSQLPARFPAAVLLAVHGLTPKQSDDAGGALADRSGLPCRYGIDREPIAPSRVYVAPPDKHMLVAGDELRVIFGPKENCNRPALDPLFRTAAVSCGKRAIAVFLCAMSGAADDGLLGLSILEQCGGTIVLPRVLENAPARAKADLFRRVSPAHTPAPDEVPALLVKLTKGKEGEPT